MKKTIHAQSGHTLFIQSIKYDSLPDRVKKFEYINNFPNLYVVKNWNADGHIFMYLGKGHDGYPDEICIWYAQNGSFWSGFGKTFEDAINNAQKDGWMYA